MKPGYKQTEVGVIPEEWEISDLQQICRAPITYGIVQCGPHLRDGVPYIRVSDMDGPELEVDSMLRTSKSIASKFARSTVEEGDLVYALRGKLGEVRQVRAELAGANLTQGTARLSPNDRVASDYFIWALRDPRALKHAELEAKGTTFREITLADLRRVSVLVPPLREQRAIAAALSEADALLAALDRLIAKKRDLKQAAMQQLLTGQTRLPGFEGEWVVERLGEIGVFLKGSGVKKDEARSGPLPCIRYGEIYTKHKDVIAVFHSFISAEVAATAKLLKKGDVLFAGSGETKEDIGKCVAFVGECEAYAGGDIVILRPHSADSKFLGYALNTPAINRQKASRGQGDAVVHIGSSALAEVAVNVPPLPEQTAIAAVLSDMDAELAALEQRREKTRALKQGMMQELLTGRTRLV
jgi:type I restriction enzyme S subunit